MTRSYETEKQVGGSWHALAPSARHFPGIPLSCRAYRPLHRMRGGWPLVALACKPCATLCQTSHAGSRWRHQATPRTPRTPQPQLSTGEGDPTALRIIKQEIGVRQSRQGPSAREEDRVVRYETGRTGLLLMPGCGSCCQCLSAVLKLLSGSAIGHSTNGCSGSNMLEGIPAAFACCSGQGACSYPD